MARMFRHGSVFIAMLLGVSLFAVQAAPKQPKPPKPDLATAVQGTYHGEVTSDARGASRTGVDVTVTRTGPNTVAVASTYTRIPARTFRLSRVMNTIQATHGGEVFLLEQSKSPPRLSLTIDDASWVGTRD